MDKKLIDKILVDLVGTKGVETLKKNVYHRDSQAELGPLDLYLPLLVVPRAILSWLAQNIGTMQIGESKELSFPGKEDIQIKIDKQGRDSYRAEFIQAGKIIHSFEKQTLPNVGGHMLTFGEMYEHFTDGEDSKSLEGAHVHDLPEGGHTGVEESPEEAMQEEASGYELPQAIMNMHNLSEQVPFQGNAQRFDMSVNNEVALSLVSAVGKLVDALVANQLTNTITEKLIPKAKQIEEVEEDEESEEEIEKDEFKSPSGHAKPKEPIQPKGAIAPSHASPVAQTRKQAQASKDVHIPHRFSTKKVKQVGAKTDTPHDSLGKVAQVEADPSSKKIYFKEKLRKLKKQLNKDEDSPGVKMLRDRMNKPKVSSLKSRDELINAALSRQNKTPLEQPKATAQVSADNEPFSYESHKAKTDAVHTKTAKPKLLRQFHEDDDETMPVELKVYLATHPDHKNMIGAHHELDEPYDFNSTDLPSSVYGVIEDASNKGFDRVILHNPEPKKPVKQVGHLKVIKKEKEIYLKEHEMYTQCIHCDTPEFIKTEAGFKYKPCACFAVTIKNEDGEKVPFLEVIKKKDQGYLLKFSNIADKEVVNAFLKTLKSRLQHKAK